MVIYPAIDIIDGKCVRLVQGKFEDVTVYSDNPVEIALKWQQLGAKYLHVVDLDGAKKGSTQNTEVIKEIVSVLQIPVQTGGGIRSIENVQLLLSYGVSRVILGTSAVRNPSFVRQAIAEYGDSIAIGIDAKNGMVAIEGWEKISDRSAIEFALQMKELGAGAIIYTDISRDGMLQGPNTKAMSELVQKTGLNVIASGGVSSIEDLLSLKTTGVEGAIVGKAIYTGAVDLKKAIELT